MRATGQFPVGDQRRPHVGIEGDRGRHAVGVDERRDRQAARVLHGGNRSGVHEKRRRDRRRSGKLPVQIEHVVRPTRLSSMVDRAVVVRSAVWLPETSCAPAALTYSVMRRPYGSSPMWVRKSTSRPSRASPTATLSGLPPTCSPSTWPSWTMSISDFADHQPAGHCTNASNVARAPLRCNESSAQRYASTNRWLMGQIAEHRGDLDERGGILVLRPGDRDERIRQLVDHLVRLAPLVDALGVAGPACHRR